MSRPATKSTPKTTTPAPVDLAAEHAFISRVLRDEAEAVARLAEADPGPLHAAVSLIVAAADGGGTVLISGLGKSGHIGEKISATLASLGIPSHTVHPTEAAHGDLGRFRPQDLALCLSHSGQTEELVGLATILRQDGIKIIAITGAGAKGAPPSDLARIADVSLTTGVSDEAGEGFSLAPTSSTTATLAIGDALALAAARRRSFTDADFHRRHPGGQLGGQLRPVVELLRFRAGDNLPLIESGVTVADALKQASQAGRRPGALLVVAPGTGELAGIFTDGDLRRLVLNDPADLNRPIDEMMTASPRSLPDTAVAKDAVQMIREHRQDEIPVVDPQGRPVGLLDVQDLITMKLVQG